MPSSRPDRERTPYDPTDNERTQSERNRRFGASLRKLYRDSLDEPLSPALQETLDKLK
ncbi:hypothetical protein C725_1508 [Pacificimonas flava]|uniref:Anti-sigma factor NepR domain-containing protein n=1 Tax=Pacificimonas flava TaxID=1234595 RepID=M2SC24_9SPHN|nr:hypothetical protein C725_1508 [Pacificimonas flava]